MSPKSLLIFTVLVVLASEGYSHGILLSLASSWKLGFCPSPKPFFKNMDTKALVESRWHKQCWYGDVALEANSCHTTGSECIKAGGSAEGPLTISFSGSWLYYYVFVTDLEDSAAVYYCKQNFISYQDGYMTLMTNGTGVENSMKKTLQNAGVELGGCIACRRFC